jgi:hypothetical protein
MANGPEKSLEERKEALRESAALRGAVLRAITPATHDESTLELFIS